MINQTEEKLLFENLLIAKYVDKQEIFSMLERKFATIEELYKRYNQCQIELAKNKRFIFMCENEPKIDTKKQNKFIKSLEKAEHELQELRDLIIKQNELKKVSPAGFEDVFEQTKIQMNIRKNDLKKKVKDLKNKIEYCNTESQRNIECLEITNECLRKEMKELMLSKEETEKEIMQLERRLKEMEEAQYKRICTEEKEGVKS